MGLFENDKRNKHDYIKKGLNYANLNDHTKAIEELESALEQFPNDEEILINLAFIYADLQQYEPAQEILIALTNTNSYNIEAFNTLGHIYVNQNKYNEAVAIYEKGIKYNSNAAILYNSLGNLYYDAGGYLKALQLFKKAADLDSNFLERYYHLGFDSFINGSELINETIKTMQESINNNLNKAKIIHDSGIVYLEHHMNDKAIIAFNQALNIYPNYLSAYLNLGDTYQQKEDYENAIKTFEKALTYNPQNAKIYNSLGITYDKLNKTDAAVEMYKQAAILDKTYENSHFMLGQFYQNRGNTEKATEEFIKHIRIYETENSVEDALKRIAIMKSITVQKALQLVTTNMDIVHANTLRKNISKYLSIPISHQEISSTNLLKLPYIKEVPIDEPTASNEYKRIQEGPDKAIFDTGTVETVDEASTTPIPKEELATEKFPDLKKQPKQMPIIPVESVHNSSVHSIGPLSAIQAPIAVPYAPRHPITPQGTRKISSPSTTDQAPQQFKLKPDEENIKPKTNRNYF
ncbi:MAG: tetratricopeptide repeat protein [bacterium]